MPKTIKELLEEHSRYIDSNGELGTQLTTERLQSFDFDRYDDLQGANLQGANLEGAHLEDAFLYGANLKWARLEGADFTGAKMTDEQKEYVLSKGAIINA